MIERTTTLTSRYGANDAYAVGQLVGMDIDAMYGSGDIIRITVERVGPGER